MSAYSNLVGLYPASKRMSFISDDDLQTNNWPEELPWQPIPVHTVPKPLDHVRSFVRFSSITLDCSFQLMGVSSCEFYEELVDQMRRSSRITSLNKEFQVTRRLLDDFLRFNWNIVRRICSNTWKSTRIKRSKISSSLGISLIRC